MSAVADWSPAKRILCVRLDNLGDVLMTTPALHALGSARPDRELTLLTSPAGAALAAHLPGVARTIAYDAPWVKNGREGGCDPAPDRALIDTLAAGAFDAAAIFTVYSQSPLPAALACLLAGIPRRLGYCRENPYALLTDWLPETEPAAGIRHEVRRQLDLARHVAPGCGDERLRFALSAADRASARRKLARAGARRGGRPLVIVHPGASAPSRRYPPAQFAAAIDFIAGAIDCDLVLSGAADEAALVDAIRREAGVPTSSLAGALTLGELGAAIAEAALLVSNNTGPVHLAAALGTPVVDLYALTNPQHTPWQVPHRLLFHDVPCRNCYKSVCPQLHHDCLRRVPPAAVARAALELLAETRGGWAGRPAPQALPA